MFEEDNNNALSEFKMATQKIKSSIRAKYMFAAGSLLVIAVIFLSIIIFFNARRILLEEGVLHGAETAAHAEKVFLGFLKAREGSLDLLFASPSLQGTFEANNGVRERMVQTLDIQLNSSLRNEPALENIIFVANGKIKYDFRHRFHKGNAIKSEIILPSALVGIKGDVAILMPSELGISGTKALLLMHRKYEGGGEKGPREIFAFYDLESIWKSLFESTFISKHGFIAFAWEDLRHRLLAIPADFGSMEKKELNNILINSKDISKLEGDFDYVMLKSRLIRNSRIALLAVSSLNDITIPVRNLSGVSLIYGLVVAIIGALMVFRISRNISRPVIDLSKTVSEFSEGNMAVRAEVNTQDEIGLLATNFNSMAEHLEHVYSKLKDYSADLEQKNLKLDSLDKYKDEFFAKTSHELRTPLNGMMGIIEAMLEDDNNELNEASRYSLFLLLNSSRRLANLVNDILDVENMRKSLLTLNLKSLDVKAVIDFVVNLAKPLAADKAIIFTTQIENGLPLLLADEERLQQILLNLLGNAIKFTEEGEITLAAKKTKGMVEIFVRDPGIGIEKNKLQDIFNAFEQVDNSLTRIHEGCGLGLTIVKQMVDLHRGRIWVESELGKGSTFHFSIPASRKVISENSFLPTRKSAVARIEMQGAYEELHKHYFKNSYDHPKGNEDFSWKILVVDDDEINRQVLVKQLRNQKHAVIAVNNGEEALKAIANEKGITAVLLDVMMPVLSGFEVCKLMREKHSPLELPIIFLTAKNTVEDIVNAFKCGANDYLCKPFSSSELNARLAAQVNLSKATSESEKLSKMLARVLGATKQLAMIRSPLEAVVLTLVHTLDAVCDSPGVEIDIAFKQKNTCARLKYSGKFFIPTDITSQYIQSISKKFERCSEATSLEFDKQMEIYPTLSKDGELRIPVVRENELLACMKIKPISEFTKSDADYIFSLGQSLSISLENIRYFEENDERTRREIEAEALKREQENLRKIEEEQKRLIYLVSIAAQISDKINSPLLVASNSFENLSRKLHAMYVKHPEYSAENYKHIFDIWLRASPLIKSSLDKISSVTKLLEELREGNGKIEATASIIKEKKVV